jgi:hypothetical protein
MKAHEKYEMYMMQYAEGTLSEAEERELFAYLEQHPELLSELEEWKELRVSPDTTIHFPDKNMLLKNSGAQRIPWVRISLAAAVLLLGILVFPKLFVNNDNGVKTSIVSQTTIQSTEKVQTTEPQLAQTEQTPEKPVIMPFQPQRAPSKVISVKHTQPDPVVVVSEESIPEIAEDIRPLRLPNFTLLDETPVMAKLEEPILPPQPAGMVMEAMIGEEEYEQETESKGLLKLLPIKQKKLANMETIHASLNERVEQVKENWKNTSWSIVIAQRELFTINF